MRPGPFQLASFFELQKPLKNPAFILLHPFLRSPPTMTAAAAGHRALYFSPPPTINRRKVPRVVTFTVHRGVKEWRGRRLVGVGLSCRAMRAVDGGPWDDEAPYEILPSGKRAYLDEQDVVTFLDPPKELIPLDPDSYNPAAYLWKKIEDIPPERRHRLLNLLNPRLITRAWQVAGTRYENPKLAKRSALNLLQSEDNGEMALEFYNCRSSGGVWSISWLKSFKKVSLTLIIAEVLKELAIFRCDDGKIFGRLTGGSLLSQISNTLSPLYFMVTEHKEVMSTEQPCDLAYEFGDGHMNLHNYPQGFPKPGKHPYPFDDQVVIYVRHVGPGVSIGQAWQEGKELQQLPRKLCGEILMVKD